MTGSLKGSGEPTMVLSGSAADESGEIAASLPLSSFVPGSGERLLLAGRYEILGLLGAGGMGTVYRARDLELGEVVVLKVLRRELADAPEVVERFRSEVRLARRVTHGNVARVFDIGEHGGDKFLTMELIEGESLAALIEREGAPPLERALAIASGIAAGLASAHRAGVVHRDLKPDNVLLGGDGRVVVTDFGIACALVEGAEAALGPIFGTLAYMAPEQFAGLVDADARADVYAFGAVLYELFTGERAWQGSQVLAVASARVGSPPPDPRVKKPDLPAAAAELVIRCMALWPDARPKTFEQVAEALAAIALPARAPAPAGRRAATPTLPVAPMPSEHHAARTVAVLPFRNAGAPEDDYLAEELTDDLIDALSMTRLLKVRARGVVARFRGVDRDPREIGRELGVQVVVEGSVRRARGVVRVSARLVSVGDGFQLWATRVQRPEQDVLSINDEVARAIAGALTLEAGGSARDAPSDPVAIDLYIRGRHEYRKFWPEHQRRAVALFEQAAATAPDDPMILAAKAMALSRLSYFAGAEGLAAARRTAERAASVGPKLGEARLALGAVLLASGEGKGAVREMRAAIVRSPGLAEAHAALGRLLVEVGAVDEGRRRLEAALELDPHVPLAIAAMVRSRALLGAWDAADALVDQLREVEGPFSYWTFRARLAMWRRLPNLPAGASLDDAPAGAIMGLPLALLEVLRTHRRPDDAPTLDDLARIQDIGVRRRIMYFQMYAEMSGYLDDEAGVLGALRLADEAGLIDLLWIDRCPLFDGLRGHPRFAAVHAAVKRRADEILAAYAAG